MWLKQATRIARTEWTRHHRDVGNPWSGRPALLVAVATLSVVLGWLALSLGRDLASGRAFPDATLGLLVSAAFGWLVWRSSQYTNTRFEQLHPDLLLTIVPARAVALGLLGFVYARLLATLAVPTVAVAVGLAVGLQSPTVTLTVVAAVAGMTAIAVAVGTTGRLAARLVALRLVRVRFYRDLLVVFGWIPLLVGAMILRETSLSISPLLAVFGALPLTWFVDLAFVGVVEFGSARHSLGALGVLAVSLPALAAGATVLARRVWESEPTNSTVPRGSHSLLSVGLLERVAGDRIPRPVYTVARERWLMERRVPRGLLSTAYAMLVMGLFVFPVIAVFGGTATILVFFAVTLGIVAGVAFGSDPIGTEYRVLQMLLTSVSGRHFVAGLLLATTVVGVPLVAVVVVPLGVAGDVGLAATVLSALVGAAVSACTASVAIATGLDVHRYDYVQSPFFFTDVPIYAEQGLRAFLRLGLVIALPSLASAPAFVGTAPAVYEYAMTLGVPAVVVRLGSFLVALSVVAVVTRTAFRMGVHRFRHYQFE